MPPYFVQDRFAPAGSDVFQSASGRNPDTPQTHELDPRRTSIKVLEPSVRQAFAANGAQALGLLEDAARGYVGLRQNQRIIDLRSELQNQLPSGKDYVVVISSPGGYGYKEGVDVYEKGAEPEAVMAPQDNRIQYEHIKGRGPSGASPDFISLSDPSGGSHQVPVHPLEPAPRPPAHATSNRPLNAVDREPHGLPRGSRELPADAKNDKGYPGSGRMNA